MKDSLLIVTVRKDPIWLLKQSKSHTFLLTRYSASISHSGIDNYDDYNLKYNSVSITVDDSATFASLGFTCDQTLSEGKSYNVQ